MFLLHLVMLAVHASTAVVAQPTSAYGQERCYPPEYLLMVRRMSIGVDEIAHQLNEEKALTAVKGKRYY